MGENQSNFLLIGTALFVAGGFFLMLTGDLGVGLVTSGLFGAFGVGEAARRWLHGSARDYVVAAMVAGVGLVCGLIS